jgi:two-component system copper resistance phosphate regulon response regulator CusR
MRILVVEDQKELAQSLKAGLEAECYAVDVENDGERGLYRARTNDYDLVLLDNVLPGKEGSEVCRELREYKMTAPILILSVQSEIEQKVGLLNCGADDYLTKPFSFTELSARVRALLRRPRQVEESSLIIDDLVLDRQSYSAFRNQKAIYLTPKEFTLLEYLMKNQDKVLSRGMIMEHVWDENADPFSNSIETHIMNLRRKIDRGSKQKLIHTVPGRGYKVGIAS